jgi:leucyl aminopeptidase
MKTRIAIELFSSLPDKSDTIFSLVCENIEHTTHLNDFPTKLKETGFTGSAKEKKLITKGNKVIVALGAGSSLHNSDLSGFRRAIGKTISEAKDQNLSDLCIEIYPTINSDLEYISFVFAETVTLSLYSFEHIYSNQAFPQKRAIIIEEIKLFVHGAENQIENLKKQIARGIERGQSLNFARYLSDLPSNQLRPRDLSLLTQEKFSELKHINTTILGKTELEKQGFGGIIAVGKGSIYEPCLAIFDYNPPNAKETIVIIGKGVTFDTGGYSIKPKKHHNEMKYDMCGAANVFSAAFIAAKEETPLRIVCMLACVENAIGDHAQRPSDVYKAWNGKLVDVYNTDAEGRLILADVIAYAASFTPKMIIDMATLTGGASQIASNMAAILCVNQESLIPIVKNAAALAGEKFIHLEILPEATESIKGTVSDYTNMNNKWSDGAATMHAAAFLQEFVPKNVEWIHLDIASMAYNGRENGYLPSNGATSFGSRTIVNILKSIAEK